MKLSSLLNAPFFDSIHLHAAMEALFDGIPDIVYYVKDADGRYMSVNDTLVTRTNSDTKANLIGKTTKEIFPKNQGAPFRDQDLQVIKNGQIIRNHLELHLYPNGHNGWCLTYKQPITNPDGKIIGLCGISRDIQAEATKDDDFKSLATVTDYIHKNYHLPLRLPSLAEMANLSVYQFDQRIRSLFHMSAGQYLVKVRVDAARDMLINSKESIAAISQICGYSDQSAFSRQFKQAVGTSPLAYRKSSTKAK